MDDRLKFGGAAVIVSVLVAWFAVRVEHSRKPAPPPPAATPAVPVDVAASPQTLEAMKKAGPVAGTAVYGVHSEDLRVAKSEIKCDQVERLARDVNPDDAFWRSETAPSEFIFYDHFNKVLTVCDGQNATSAMLGDGPDVVKLDQPHFGDWAHDGKHEFILFRGQCTSGICQGLYHIMKTDGMIITRLAEINADGVDTEQMSIGNVSRMSLQIRSVCFSPNNMPAFSYVTVVDFGGPEIFKLVPPSQIRLRSPELLLSLDQKSADADAPDAATNLALQQIVYQAYQGKSLAESKTALEALGPLKLQCDPKAILEMITEGK